MHSIKTSKAITIMTMIFFAVIIGMQNSVLVLISKSAPNSALIINQDLETNQPVVVGFTLSDLFRKPPKRPRSIRQKNPLKTQGD
jgi:hypothetical protein